jgi:molybdate-binding protein/DNA-binding HxlR family transcriptional regulator
MKQSENVQSIRAAKILGDERRLNILRLLMRGPATLTQLGKVLDAHPAKVRHHLKLLEEAGFIELKSMKIVRGFVEKYYVATSKAYVLNLAILPEPEDADSIVMMGSHDLALEVLAEGMHTEACDTELFCVSVGSLDGLIALRQGLCHIAGCHLLGSSGDDFNISHVQHLFPGRSMALVTVGYRQQGILTQKGNPKKLSEIGDLARDDIFIVNRQPGSGTRLWLDRGLSEIGIPRSQVSGYGYEVKTHHQVGKAVSSGEADAGLGLFAEAEMMELDFSPLFEERYDLVLPAEDLANPSFTPLFDRLHSGDFRQMVSRLGGYETERTGEMLYVGQEPIGNERLQ